MSQSLSPLQVIPAHTSGVQSSRRSSTSNQPHPFATSHADVWHRLAGWDAESVSLQCRDIVEQLNQQTESVSGLFMLLCFLDIDCSRVLLNTRPPNPHPHNLRRLPTEPGPAIRPHLLGTIVLALFNRSNAFYSRSGQHDSLHHEVHLRALVSGLTLLRYYDHTTIVHNEWIRLREASARLLNDVQRTQSVSKGICSYLSLLASDYFNTFSSDQKIYEAVIAKVVSAACVTGLSFQYDVRRMLEEAKTVFEPLPRKRGVLPEHQTLLSLYEIARIIEYAVNRFQTTSASANDKAYYSSLAMALTKLSVEHTVAILNCEDLEPPKTPNFLSRFGRTVASTVSTAHLDKQTYIYGVLDNAARICKYFDITEIDQGSQLREIIRRNVKPTTVVEYREKLCDILFAHESTRQRNFNSLLPRLKDALASEVHHIYSSSLDSSSENRILVPIRTHISQLQPSPQSHIAASSPQSASSLLHAGMFGEHEVRGTGQPRISSSTDAPTITKAEDMGLLTDFSDQLQIATPTSPSTPTTATLTSNTHRLSTRASLAPNEAESRSTSNGTSNPSASPRQSSSRTAPSFQTLLTMDEFHLEDRHPLDVKRIDYQLDEGRRGKIDTSSTISSNGDLVLYRGERRINIFKLPAHSRDPPERSPIMVMKSAPRQIIKTAALTSQVVAVLTSAFASAFYLHKIAPTYSGPKLVHDDYMCEIKEEFYSPKCVALFPRGDLLYIALGWSGREGQDQPGKVTLHEFTPNSNPHRASEARLLFEKDLPDHPKKISFGSNGSLLCCHTRQSNIIYIWQIEGDPTKPELVCQTDRPFSEDSGAEGITSATVFDNPVNDPASPYYLFCTTSWSSARIDNEGELSFLAPATHPFPAFESVEFHGLQQYTREARLVAGSVPLSGNIAAVLDVKGRVSLVPFRLAPNGRHLISTSSTNTTTSRNNPLTFYKIRETWRSCSLELDGGSVLFVPSGERIIAADNAGNVLILEFARRRTDVAASVASQDGSFVDYQQRGGFAGHHGYSARTSTAASSHTLRLNSNHTMNAPPNHFGSTSGPGLPEMSFNNHREANREDGESESSIFDFTEFRHFYPNHGRQ